MTMRLLGIAATVWAAMIVSAALLTLASDPASASPRQRMEPQTSTGEMPTARRQTLDRRLRARRQDDRCRRSPRAC